MPALDRAPLIAIPPRSVADRSCRLPSRRPTGVRAPATMTDVTRLVLSLMVLLTFSAGFAAVTRSGRACDAGHDEVGEGAVGGGVVERRQAAELALLDRLD